MWKRIARAMLPASLWRGRAERDLEQEISFHLAEEERLRSAAGQRRAEARSAARRDFGNIGRVKEVTRGMWGGNRIETFFRDGRYALRQLRRTPVFTCVVILTLAVGIGANTAIFSVVNAILLRPLPWPEPSQLVLIHEALPTAPFLNVSWPDYNDWLAQSRAFEGLGVLQPSRVKARVENRAEMVPAASVSASLFKTLGAKPMLGRLFSESDDKPGAAPVAVLSPRMWRRVSHGATDLSGQAIVVGGQSIAVVGVLDPDFRLPYADPDVLMPIGQQASAPEFLARANHPGLIAIGRLRPGVSLARARVDLNTIMARLALAYPASNRGETAQIAPLPEALIGDVGREVLMLFGAVGFVLLLACANVAHLALARASERQREFAIRLSLGAGRGRLVRQLLTENILLALAGAAAGLLLARLGIGPLVRLSPYESVELSGVHLDPLVLLFTLAASVAAALLFGFAPMLQAIGTRLTLAGREKSDSRAGGHVRSALFITEVALALLLTTGAGLLIRSVSLLLHIDVGLRPDGLLAIDLERYGNESADRSLRFFNEAIDRIAHQPGVISVAAAMCPPLSPPLWTSPWWGEGRPPREDQRQWTALNMITPQYFRTTETPLVSGRFFTAADTAAAPAVAVVNRTMARALSRYGNPVGRTLHVQYAARGTMLVVGVVADISQFGPGRPAGPEVYVPAAQMPVKFMTIVVRTGLAPDSAARAATTAIQDLDHDQPISRIAPLNEAILQSLARQRFAAVLLSIFGSIALLLAAVGVSGLMASSVVRRGREFGVRIALGARRTQLLTMILLEGLRLTSAGILAGLMLSWALTRMLAGLLYRVRPVDPVIFAMATALLIIVALAACAAPAWRASHRDAMESLRHD